MSIEQGLNSHVGKPTATFEHGLFRVFEGFVDFAQREHQLGNGVEVTLRPDTIRSRAKRSR